MVRLALQAISEAPYPGLVVSRKKIEDMVRLCVSSAKHFAWVSEDGGLIGGALVAYIDECTIYERQQASVVQFYCTIHGDGRKLLDKFLAWARSRPAIKIIAFVFDTEADPRIAKLLDRKGVSRALPVFIELR